MKALAVTVGIPVRDLARAIDWYRCALDLAEPDVVPMDGLAEFDLGPFWLQLTVDLELAGRHGIAVNISVEDATALRGSLSAKGLTVSELQRFDGVVDYFELTDLDGNTIGIVTELA